MSNDPRFWCISVYFNPAGFTRTAENFLVFAEALRASGVNLLVVELSFDGRYYLPADDCSIRLRGKSVMWQKERLIALAVSRLPRQCQYVAWIDGDVIFTTPDWHRRAMQMLEEVDLLQLFSRIHYLGRPGPEVAGQGRLQSLFGNVQRVAEGLIAQRARVGPEWPRLRGSPGLERALPGYCWAARRAFWDEVGLYDRAVIGAGDKLFAHLLVGLFDPENPPIAMSDPMREDVWRWGQTLQRGRWRFDHLPVDILHLWHGRSNDRQYQERHLVLRDADFDPHRDLAVVDGVLEWASDKPTLHQALRRFFELRREDA